MDFPSKILCCLCLFAGLLLSGCAPSKFIEVSRVQDILDEAEYPAKKMRELKDDPAGASLAKSYEMFVALHEAMDSSLIDSARLSRRAFFEQWKLESDSICGSLDRNGELSLEIRAVYEAALRFGFESDYDYLLKEQDSLHYEARKDIPFEDKVEYLKSVGCVVPHFFVVENQIAYFVKPAKTLKALEAFADSLQGKSGSYKVANMACMDKNPMGQETLVLTKKYSTLLDAFMGVSREHRSWFSSDLKDVFLEPAISVWPVLWGYGFHYESFPAIMSVVFNENRTLAILNVMSSFNGGGFYSLEKRDGVWKVVEYKRTRIM